MRRKTGIVRPSPAGPTLASMRPTRDASEDDVMQHEVGVGQSASMRPTRDASEDPEEANVEGLPAALLQ